MTEVYVGYCRVSTKHQSLDRQFENLSEYAKKHNFQFKKIFSEKVSGKDLNRPELENLLEFVREGDTIVSDSFSRICRNLKNLIEIINFLKEKKVNLITVKENLDISTPSGMMMVHLMGIIHQFERDISLERQLEGIDLAKHAGKYKGRKPVQLPANYDECYKKYTESTRFNKYTFKQFMLDTGLKKATLIRRIADTKNTKKQMDQSNQIDLSNQID
jgi:DNA invertase Pin-like site-specific DNA recombinase